jgi:alkylated DNA repair dioxygenase AlkB
LPVRNGRWRIRVLNGVAQQIGLFGAQPEVFVDDESGRIAYYPAVFDPREAAELFSFLERTLEWSHETMWMYERTVDVPRLIARFEQGRERPEQLHAVQRRVEDVLGTQFNALSVQYYRGGTDSVAWHNDHRDELIALPTIALLSLGATREMLVRSKGRPRRSFGRDLEAGSLFVMSGRAQEFWEHTIPKVPRPVTPRISIALRQRRA